MPDLSIKKKFVLIFFFALALAWFFNIGHVHLMEPDEGRYAEIPREMVSTGDYLTPRLNGLFYFEKPPLQYWMTAFSYKTFGFSEWAARFYATLTGFLTALALFLFARLQGDRELGIWSALIWASSPMPVLMGRVLTLDTSLTFYLTVVLLASLYLVRANLSKREKLWANVFFWTAGGLGFLTKGLLVFVVPGLTVLLFMLLTRSFRFFRNLNWVWGPALLLFISAPWVAIMSKTHPSFFDFFIIYEHFTRFLDPSHDRMEPFWYFLPLVVIGLFPSIFAFFRRDLRSSVQRTGHWRAMNLFLFLWAITFVGFFSLSKSKLAPYILPAFPALALLAAQLIKTRLQAVLRVVRWGYIGLALGLFFVGTYIRIVQYETKVTPAELYSAFAQHLMIALAFFLIVLLSGQRFLEATRPRVALLSYLFSGLLLWQIAYWNFNAFSSSRSGHEMVESMQPHLTGDTEIFSVGDYVQSATFYLGRTVRLTEYTGELKFGLENSGVVHPQKLEEFVQEWGKAPRAMAIVSQFVFKNKLQDTLSNYKVIYSNRRRLVLLKTGGPT